MLPEVAIVKIADIKIDPDYQREINKGHVAKLKKAFDVGAIKAVSLMRCDGVLLCYDGQHTIEAAKDAGLGEVPATIVNGTREKAGRLFLLLNDKASKRVAMRDLQRVGANVGESVSIQAQKLLEDFGLSVSCGGTSAGKTNAIGAIRRYCRTNEEQLRIGMRFAYDLWKDEPETWTGTMIRCLYDAAGQGEGFLSRAKAACRKRHVTPRRILDFAAAVQYSKGTPGGGAAYMLRGLKELSGVE